MANKELADCKREIAALQYELADCRKRASKLQAAYDGLDRKWMRAIDAEVDSIRMRVLGRMGRKLDGSELVPVG